MFIKKMKECNQILSVILKCDFSKRNAKARGPFLYLYPEKKVARHSFRNKFTKCEIALQIRMGTTDIEIQIRLHELSELGHVDKSFFMSWNGTKFTVWDTHTHQVHKKQVKTLLYVCALIKFNNKIATDYQSL